MNRREAFTLHRLLFHHNIEQLLNDSHVSRVDVLSGWKKEQGG